jgi:hypothetical protein
MRPWTLGLGAGVFTVLFSNRDQFHREPHPIGLAKDEPGYIQTPLSIQTPCNFLELTYKGQADSPRSCYLSH